jgi:hypothetical protein
MSGTLHKGDFERLDFSADRCRRSLAEFGTLLAERTELSERGDVLDFFRSRRDLSGFIGVYNGYLGTPDLLRHEYDLFGDFVCDLVVGDSRSSAFTFVEFEDAQPNSVFDHATGRATPPWSRRFEHGFSQLVDWFWKLDDLKRTDDFIDRFGAGPIRATGVLVVGRREPLREREARRLRWRLDKVMIDSHHIFQLTYDDLFDDLLYRLEHRYPPGPTAGTAPVAL